jgi:hypothetical protein
VTAKSERKRKKRSGDVCQVSIVLVHPTGHVGSLLLERALSKLFQQVLDGSHRTYGWRKCCVPNTWGESTSHSHTTSASTTSGTCSTGGRRS